MNDQVVLDHRLTIEPVSTPSELQVVAQIDFVCRATKAGNLPIDEIEDVHPLNGFLRDSCLCPGRRKVVRQELLGTTANTDPSNWASEAT